MAEQPVPKRIERTRVISANDLHVLMTQFLATAEKIHIVMCHVDDDHAAQTQLNAALQSALIGATVCRQIHASPKRALRSDAEETADDD